MSRLTETMGVKSPFHSLRGWEMHLSDDKLMLLLTDALQVRWAAPPKKAQPTG